MDDWSGLQLRDSQVRILYGTICLKKYCFALHNTFKCWGLGISKSPFFLSDEGNNEKKGENNMNRFVNDMVNATNFGYTENQAVKRTTTANYVLDMFAVGGAYRKRSDKDIETLFGDAYRENKDLALKCLFYLRDVRGGQGERRFFRVAYKWLVKNDIKNAKRNFNLIPEYGRWDDLIDIAYSTAPALNAEFVDLIANQMDLDAQSKTPSLLAKWMPSENASNAETKAKARWIMNLIGVEPRAYRKRLSAIRQKINILERLMSENRWDEIEFDKIPSVAGMKYRNAFAVKEVTAARYKAFMADKSTKVNAAVLNPVDIADKVINKHEHNVDMLQKYWDNLKDYYQGREENAIAIVDTSGSMCGQPMAAAVGMGLYVATKSHGPFANCFLTFSSKPRLEKFSGDNIVDIIKNCSRADWGGSTNVEAAMDLILNTAIKGHYKQSDLPARLYIFSDMEFNGCMCGNDVATNYWGTFIGTKSNDYFKTLFERIEKKFARAGYKMPKVTFWNLECRNEKNIPAIGDNFNYISGFSMSQMESVMSGKSAWDMCLEVLLGKRYEAVSAEGATKYNLPKMKARNSRPFEDKPWAGR